MKTLRTIVLMGLMALGATLAPAISSGPPLPGGLAQAVNVAFNPVQGADGYRVYFGTQSRGYTNRVDIGNVTGYGVTGLAPGTKYFFAVTAYKGNLESDFSTEGSYTVPNGAPVTVVTISSELLSKTDVFGPWQSLGTIQTLTLTNPAGKFFGSRMGITWTNY